MKLHKIKKYGLLTGSLLFFIPALYAQNIISCPTIEEIKMHIFHEWLPLYIANEELASIKDTNQFINEVTRFVKAQWSKQYLENGHCFYEGGQMTWKITLAHDAWQPGFSPNWHWTQPGSLAECNHLFSKHCPFLQ